MNGFYHEKINFHEIIKKNNQNTCIHMNNVVICSPEPKTLIWDKKQHTAF